MKKSGLWVVVNCKDWENDAVLKELEYGKKGELRMRRRRRKAGKALIETWGKSRLAKSNRER